MTETRRGRISRTTYIMTIGHMLSRDWSTLEKCEVLTQFSVVNELVSTYPREFAYKGMAVRWLLDQAIEKAIKLDRRVGTQHQQRIALFLEKRRSGDSVAAIAREWGMTREHLSRTVNREAVELVTEQFLRFAHHKPFKPAA